MNSFLPLDKKIRLVDSLYTKKNSLTNLHFIQTMKTYLSIHGKDITEEDAFNTIIYGLNCIKVNKGKAKNIKIFQIDTKPQIISIVDQGEQTVEVIDITNIIAVSFDMNNENINQFKNNNPLIPIEANSYIRILINKTIIDLIFDTKKELCLFISGVIHLYENLIDFDVTNMENYFRKIWQFYDKDFSNKLEPSEFKTFVEELNFQIGQNELIKEFKKIDTDKSGYIDFK